MNAVAMKKGILSVVFALLFAFGMTLAVVALKETVAVKAADDYPEKYKKVAKDALVDDWNFYNRECTSFVAWCINNRNGLYFHNWYGGVRWGNANNWGNAARNLGITVDNNPAIGAIAWWSTGKYGHVAWVSEVKGDRIVIEEYNYNSNGLYHTREIGASNPTGYIHIQDIPQGFCLDINWEVDGEIIYTDTPSATVDVYINGNMVAEGVADYYVRWPAGTVYEIKNIKTKTGYSYKGVASGSVKGTIGNADAEVRLVFSTALEPYYYWVYRCSGQSMYAIIPKGFDQTHYLANEFHDGPITTSESNGSKQVVSEPKVAGYVYYHWTTDKKNVKKDNYNVAIKDKSCKKKGKKYNNFRAFFSYEDYGHTDKNGKNGGERFYAWFDNPEDGSWWWYRIPVYVQYFDLYEEEVEYF